MRVIRDSSLGAFRHPAHLFSVALNSASFEGESSMFANLARDFDRKGEFLAAIALFTEAFNRTPITTEGDLEILDSRAAIYSKLSLYGLALQDADEMIDTDKFDGQGYLRRSDILLLEYKLDDALEACAVGLKTLKDDNPQRDLLQQQHDTLLNMLSRKQDPFRVLPPEIIYMIVHGFTFKQTVAILRVSKAWDHCLSGIGKLWLRLDFSENVQKKVNWYSVQSCVERPQGAVMYAVLGNILSQSRPKVLELFGQCPNLEHIEILDNCRHTVLYRSLKGCKKLKTLKVSNSTKVPQSYVARFLSELPLLEEVEFQSTKSSKFQRWPNNLPNLKTLSLGTEDVSPYNDDLAEAIYVPAIRAMRLNQFHALHNRDVHCLYSMENLEKLCLVWMPPVVDDFYLMALDFRRFPRLRHLHLAGITLTERKFFLPQSIEFLCLRKCPRSLRDLLLCDETEPVELINLHTLVLYDLQDIVARTVDYFIKRFKLKLRTLRVTGCYQFDVPLALELLTERENWLAELTLLQLDMTDDPIADIILDYMPKLKTLDVSFTDISDAFVRKLADARASDDSSLPKINTLLVEGCDVSDEALIYARTQGLCTIRSASMVF